MLALCLMLLGTYYTPPIMLALCLMLLGTYYAQNYAGIIGRSLLKVYVAHTHPSMHYNKYSCMSRIYCSLYESASFASVHNHGMEAYSHGSYSTKTV